MCVFFSWNSLSVHTENSAQFHFIIQNVLTILHCILSLYVEHIQYKLFCSFQSVMAFLNIIISDLYNKLLKKLKNKGVICNILEPCIVNLHFICVVKLQYCDFLVNCLT